MNSNAHPLKVTLHSPYSQVHKAVVVTPPGWKKKGEKFCASAINLCKNISSLQMRMRAEENRSLDGFRYWGMTLWERGYYTFRCGPNITFFPSTLSFSAFK
jgi:hypothetical protein